MSFIDHDSLEVSELNSGVTQIELVGLEREGENLTARIATIQPGFSVPLHIHPTHQELIFILEGELEGTLEDHGVETLRPGQSVLAPTRKVHGLTNKSASPARVLAIFPTNYVTRELV